MKFSLSDLDTPVLSRPCENGLNLEALANPFLVIGGDTLGRSRFDIVDPERAFDRHCSGHRELAGVTAFDLAIVSPTTVRTDHDVLRRKLLTISGPDFGRQFRLDDPKCAAFMIDETARAELGDSKKAGALQVGT